MVFQRENLGLLEFGPEELLKQQPSQEEIREKYERRRKVGEGTYAVVYDGFLNPCAEYPDGLRVAIKKVKVASRDHGFDISAIREIKCLQELRHCNIVRLLDVFIGPENINLVLEYLEADLEDVIKDKELIISPADIKSWMLMTLRGLEHCHKNWIIHRASVQYFICSRSLNQIHKYIGLETK
jgi:cyclin-dependent kinase 7